jgi:hypothetical protein
MNKILITFLLSILCTSQFFGQNDILTDSISEKGKLIQKIVKSSISGIKIRNTNKAKEYIAYKLFENQYVDVQKLETIISDNEIEQLQSSPNGTLKCVGFILFAKRNNKKELVMSELNKILKQEYTIMTQSCSDAISIESLPQYCYHLITDKNFFFKPSFKLKKRERKDYSLKMMVFEMKK